MTTNQDHLIAALNATSNADLAGQDLSGLDLSGANLQGADLRGANLQETTLTDANLDGANLQGADLEGATWRSPGGHPFKGDQIPQALRTQERLDTLSADIQGYRTGTLTDQAINVRVETGELSLRAAHTIRSGELNEHFGPEYLRAHPHLRPLIDDAQAHLATHLGVVVYTKPGCQPCIATLRTLNKIGVPYTTVDLSKHPELVDALAATGISEAPIVDTGTHRWSGYRDERLRDLKNTASQPPTPAATNRSDTEHPKPVRNNVARR